MLAGQPLLDRGNRSLMIRACVLQPAQPFGLPLLMLLNSRFVLEASCLEPRLVTLLRARNKFLSPAKRRRLEASRVRRRFGHPEGAGRERGTGGRFLERFEVKEFIDPQGVTQQPI